MAGIDLILIFLLVPETQYQRDLHKALDSVGVEANSEPSTHTPPSAPSDIDDKFGNKTTAEFVETRSPTVSKKTYLQELVPWSPVHKDVNVIASFLRPWTTWCYPSVVWSVLSFSIHITW
jgi:hypothetical protein